MITDHGWVPRCTAVTLPLSDRGERLGDRRRYWEVLDWSRGLPIKVGPWGFADFPYVRVRPYFNGPWCYLAVRAMHRDRTADLG
jgi:hypothetical protein